jgi:hypothetical protein
MGFHVCEYCRDAHSSGDVILRFKGGKDWIMPDMILHYIEKHQYLPCDDFQRDVQLLRRLRPEEKSEKDPTPIGYLTGDYPKGTPKLGFLHRLKQTMKEATEDGDRLQTRGMNNGG